MRSVLFFAALALKAAPLALEVTMSAFESLLDAETFRVEVFGWDESEVFFVEKSELEWDDFAGKQISLKRMLPDGALVVLRVWQPFALRESPPFPYQVEFIGCDPEGRHQFRLNPLHPCYDHDTAAAN